MTVELKGIGTITADKEVISYLLDVFDQAINRCNDLAEFCEDTGHDEDSPSYLGLAEEYEAHFNELYGAYLKEV